MSKLTGLTYSGNSLDVSAIVPAASFGSIDLITTHLYFQSDTNQYQYTLPGNDISQAVYDSKTFGTTSTYSGMRYSPDGLNFVGTNIYSFQAQSRPVSPAFDCTGLGNRSYSTLGAGEMFSTSRDSWTRADGVKHFILDDTDRKVYQYTMSTPWDMTTLSWDSVSYDFSAVVTGNNVYAILFSDDGLSMLLCDTSNNIITEFSLSIAWDLASTVAVVTTFDFSAQTTGSVASMRYSADGTQLYLFDLIGVAYQYTLAPQTITVGIEWVDSISAAATGNKIYRDTVPSTGEVEIADIANGIQEYEDPDRLIGTEYKYEIQAHDGAGDETTQEVERENMDYITPTGA